MTEIEQCLFIGRGAHAVTGISLLPDRVVVQIAPWEKMHAVADAIFDHAELINLWASIHDTPADFTFPWDVIGFDSYAQEDGRWRFVLNCRIMEISFLAAWPRVTCNNS